MVHIFQFINSKIQLLIFNKKKKKKALHKYYMMIEREFINKIYNVI